MTVHSAKGLEFEYVFIPNLVDRRFPTTERRDPIELPDDLIKEIIPEGDLHLEEERRLFYVAITRAEKLLTLSCAESRYRWGQLTLGEPSRFLDEIDESLIDIPRKAAFGGVGLTDTPAKTGMPPKRNLKSVSSSSSSAFEASDSGSLQTGMKVEHPKFGKGKVIAVEGSGPNKKATVFFNGVGKKSLLLRFAKLKIIG